MAEPQRAVRTRAIQDAVRGQEIAVLSALGISWPVRGRDHVDCPYPGHGGTNDWRWDPAKGRAYCTCSRGDSIVDVVMRCEGLPDYATAKIRTAEIIDRPDLIVEPHRSHQKTDAASLLDPLPELRDDKLVRAYLAYRLGLEPAVILMPATPVTGISALGYWLAGSGKDEKPTLLGEYPCAVFGTVSADGRTHAHRIYLAPAGQGKADLGGHDPKKSARRAEGDNTSGRSVLWGSTAAPWAILTEGIETAAAVAQAFEAEVEAGRVLVASAINAGGVEAWQPYPATRTVTVAADRDEKVKISRPNPTRRGEIAARRFGACHPGLEVRIALPGAAGESVDWLDVLLADGGSAVSAGILGASLFEANEAEEEKAASAGTSRTGSDRDWPFRLGTSGVEKRVERTDRESGEVEIEWRWFCSLLAVSAETRSAEGEEWGRLLTITDRDGRAKEWAMPMSMLAGDGTAYRERLLSLGLIMSPGKFARDALHEYIATARPDVKARCVSRIGWQSRVYVRFDRNFGGDHHA